MAKYFVFDNVPIFVCRPQHRCKSHTKRNLLQFFLQQNVGALLWTKSSHKWWEASFEIISWVKSKSATPSYNTYTGKASIWRCCDPCRDQTAFVDSICNDILDTALCCRNHNIREVFISSVAYSSKVSNELIQQLNSLLYKKCIEYGFSFINNGAVSKIDLRTDGIHIFDSGKTKIANNLISSFNYFLGTVIPNSRSH